MTSALKQVLLAAGFAALMGSAHGQGDVNFGDDESMFAMDSECDDSRFIGDGMAEPPFFPEDIGHDASDCQSAFQTGSIRLRTEDDLVVLKPGSSWSSSFAEIWILQITLQGP